MALQISYRGDNESILISLTTPEWGLFWREGSEVWVIWQNVGWSERLHAPISAEELKKALREIAPEDVQKEHTSFLIIFRPKTIEALFFDWGNLNYGWLHPPTAIEDIFRKAVLPILHLALELGVEQFREWEWVFIRPIQGWASHQEN
jgi:hypothetical protein